MDDAQQLRAFVVAADELHLGRAADRLGIHRATVAARLRALEARIGSVLIDRSHRCRIALTQAGTSVLPAARRAVAATVAFEECADGVRCGTRGTVRVALLSEPDDETESVLDELRDLDAGWEVRIERMDVEAAGRAMAVGAVEVAIGRGRRAPRTGPGIGDPRPHRLERTRAVRIGGPRGDAGMVIAWRAAWEERLADDGGDGRDEDGRDGDERDEDGRGEDGRPAHGVTLARRARAMVVAADERLRPGRYARRREAAERQRAALAERALVVEETAALGPDIAAARARARLRAVVLARVAAAQARGEALSPQLLVQWLCLQDDEDGDAAPG